ncbi:hypothetical protein [Cellulomonas sp. SG140]|uniref:hypothetical protein n=1 Tax=Cellulomonas sp. SG140 TaxID=2976536 RepID=UPI0021E80FB1|nr:hypothetical protein [Cellulomonas sp. SG140]
MPRLATALLTAAVRLLPPTARRRYREELDAELADAPHPLAFAASMLVAAPRLRWEVLTGLCGGRASMRCYVGWHGRRVLHPNAEDHTVVVLRCPRCGRLRDPRQYLPAHDADGVAWGGVYLGGH